MDAKTATFSTVIAIFLLIMLGYIARKVKVLKSEDVRVLNSVLVNITFPAFIFVNTHNNPFIRSMAVAPAIGLVSELIVLGLAYVAARMMKLDRPTTSALMLVSTFGNTAFMGYPVVQAAFPGNKHAMLSAVMFDNFGMAFWLFTIGVAIATTFAGTSFNWKNLLGFLRTPIFPVTVLALCLRTVPIPSVIIKTLDYAGAATVPLAMISIGMSLRTRAVGKYPLPVITAAILKMAVLPLLMVLLLPLVNVTGIVWQTVILQSVLPAAVFNGVITERFGGNYEFAAGTIFLTTLLGLAVIPLTLYLIL